MANLTAITLGQRQGPYVASPAGNGPQVATTMGSVAQAAANAHPAVITFSWGILAALAAVMVVYYEVLGK